MESRHLINLSVQNTLDCISENFSVKNFPCEKLMSQTSLEKCAVRSHYERNRTHIAPVILYLEAPSITKASVRPWETQSTHFNLNAVSLSAFANHGCIRFYLDKSSKINSNCPKMGSMNDSACGFTSSMGNNRINQKQNLVPNAV